MKPAGSGPQAFEAAAASTAPWHSRSNEYEPLRCRKRNPLVEPSRRIRKKTSAVRGDLSAGEKFSRTCRTMFCRYPGNGKVDPFGADVRDVGARPTHGAAAARAAASAWTSSVWASPSSPAAFSPQVSPWVP